MDTGQAETYLRLMAEAELRRALTLPPEHVPDPFHPDSAWSCSGRLRYVASGLAVAGAIGAGPAQAIADQLDSALAIRGRLGRGRLPAHPPGLSALGLLPARRTPPAPAALTAMPVGRMLALGDGDTRTDVCLVSLVRHQGRAMFGVEAALTGTKDPVVDPFNGLAAVDDRGASYGLNFTGSFTDRWAEGWLGMDPPPPAGIRWLEVPGAPGTPTPRVDVSGEATPPQAQAEPSGPAAPAERLLDHLAAGLLGQLPSHPSDRQHLDSLVAALEATHVLAPGSPAVGRLATVCQQAGFTAGREPSVALSSGPIPSADLPEPWASVLAYYGHGRRQAGEPGIAALGAVLPELDGVRFIVAGLRSQADHANLRVLACGLPPQDRRMPGGMAWIGWFPWWIRDSTGQWHVAALDGGWAGEGEFISFALRVVPPLTRAVTRLDVIVTGPAGRVRAGVPVDWVTPAGWAVPHD